jgi:hypothetical protein
VYSAWGRGYLVVLQTFQEDLALLDALLLHLGHAPLALDALGHRPECHPKSHCPLKVVGGGEGREGLGRGGKRGKSQEVGAECGKLVLNEFSLSQQFFELQ